MTPIAPILHVSARIDEHAGGNLIGRRDHREALANGFGHQLLVIDPARFGDVEKISEVDPLLAQEVFNALSQDRHLRTVTIERAFAALRLALIAEIEAGEPWQQLRETLNRRVRVAEALQGDDR